MPPTISVCMIVKNEANNLRNLLPFIKKHVDEIIVVDTGSTDDIDKVMQDNSLALYNFPWCDDFSKARNESLKYATKDYILWLDADDAIEEVDFVSLKKHLEEHPDSAVMMKLVDLRPNQTFNSTQLRVFPNHKGIQFKGRIHEQVIASIEEKGIPVTKCTAKVHHLGYQDEELMFKKLVRNTLLLEMDLEDTPDNYFNMLSLSRTYLVLGNNAKALELSERILKENKNKKEVYVETAYLVKAHVYEINNKRGDAIGVLKEAKEAFPNNIYFDIQLAELYFKNKMYRKVYNCLKSNNVWKGDWVGQDSILPLDATTLHSTVMWQMFVASLAVGDLKITQGLMQIMLKDGSFRIGGSK